MEGKFNAEISVTALLDSKGRNIMKILKRSHDRDNFLTNATFFHSIGIGKIALFKNVVESNDGF